jgi:ElaB/YqjD/DUF883 family membrane-anchored ribosome-binding protein
LDEALRDESGQAEGSANGARPEQIIEKAREEVRESLEKAREQVDARLGPSAAQLEHTAGRLREVTGDKEGFEREVGEKLAESMETTAGYLKEHSSEEIVHDLESYVKKHPAQALIGAVFAGFLFGRMIR